MRQLETNCRNCGCSMRIEVEDSSFFTDEGLCEMATCDNCYTARERIEKANRERYDKLVAKELRQPEKSSKWRRKPYND